MSHKTSEEIHAAVDRNPDAFDAGFLLASSVRPRDDGFHERNLAARAKVSQSAEAQWVCHQLVARREPLMQRDC